MKLQEVYNKKKILRFRRAGLILNCDLDSHYTDYDDIYLMMKCNGAFKIANIIAGSNNKIFHRVYDYCMDKPVDILLDILENEKFDKVEKVVKNLYGRKN